MKILHQLVVGCLSLLQLVAEILDAVALSPHICHHTLVHVASLVRLLAELAQVVERTVGLSLQRHHGEAVGAGH
eukprot:3695932-Pyramimonas_sp.AAC.1